MVSKAKVAANARYNVKTYDVISFRVQKSENINQRIDDAIQGTNTSKAAFILDAIRAKLDGPQPDTTPATDTASPPQPATNAAPTAPDGYTLVPCRPDQEPLKVLLPVDKRYNQRIQQAVNAGHAPSRAAYVMRVLDEQLYKDFHSPAPRQYDLPDDFFTGDPADNPPPLF